MKKIYLIAPSFGCTTSPYKERLDKALKTLKKLGFEYIIGKNVYLNNGIASSNTPELRAIEFINAYKSDADIIWSVGGGEVMCEILEYIDFNELKKYKPKLFIGYSDNTNLTYTLTTHLDIETIYGINAPSLYQTPLKYSEKEMIDLLNGKKEFYGFKSFQLYDHKDELFPKLILNKRKIITAYNYTKPFKGIMLGGCLDCLSILCGTKFDNTVEYINKKNDKLIFYLEACDLTSIGIRRALFQLKNAGWFKNVSGFVIGRSLNYYDNSFGTTPIDSYIDILGSLNVPLLINCDLGHIPPTLPFKNGVKATVKYVDKNINIIYEK